MSRSSETRQDASARRDVRSIAPYSGGASGAKTGAFSGPLRVVAPPDSGVDADGLIRLYNLEAERGALAGALLDSDVIDEMMLVVRPEDFWRAAHATIWRRICELRGRGEPVDCVTLGAELELRGELEAVGGDEAIAEIVNSVPHAANACYHASLVRQKSIMRELSTACAESISDCRSGRLTASEALETAERRIFAIREREVTARGTAQTIDALMSHCIETHQARMETGAGPAGWRTGFTDLDDLLGGFKPGEYVILAARPSMGKTAFGMQAAVNVAAKHGVRALFFSLEMDRGSLANRLLATVGRVDGLKLQRGQYSPDDFQRLVDAYAKTKDLGFTIDDASNRTVGEIAAIIRRAKHREGLDLVVIDYITLIDGQGRRGESRQEEVARVSRGLKAVAKDTGCCLLVLSQLNRGVEGREDRQPRLSDLRESGQIEQDADVVLLLHRPEYYDPNEKPGVAEVIVAKNRNGTVGKAELLFERRFTRFDNLASQY